MSKSAETFRGFFLLRSEEYAMIFGLVTLEFHEVPIPKAFFRDHRTFE